MSKIRGLRPNLVMLDDDTDFKYDKQTDLFKTKHTPRQRNRMPGKRAKRVARFLNSVADVLFSSNPNVDRTRLMPVYYPALGNQLKRGLKPQRNDKCVCGSGKKFKKCCKELEMVTPYLMYDEVKPRVLDPVEEARKLEAEAQND